MAAKIAYAASYAADVATVFPILTAQRFLEDCAREIGADSWKVAVTLPPPALVTQVDVRAPTGNIPAAFRRFVGHHVDISEKRTWNSPASDGSHRGTLTARAVVGGRAAFVRGTLMLEPVADAARFTVNADIHVWLGLLSQLASAKLRELLTSVLNDQTTVLNRWLATGGG